ncbi:MAG: hypothetical protein IT335_04730 [Thermomicrobiales bacterium]|nr:hypothetical protein [Thermomicrobiales bacterium]
MVNDALVAAESVPGDENQPAPHGIADQVNELSPSLVGPTTSPLTMTRGGEDRVLMIAMVLGLSGVVGVLFGVLLGPPLLQQALESLFQAPIENTAGFRQTGGIVGGILGLFFGSIIGTIYR